MSLKPIDFQNVLYHLVTLNGEYLPPIKNINTGKPNQNIVSVSISIVIYMFSPFLEWSVVKQDVC